MVSYRSSNHPLLFRIPLLWQVCERPSKSHIGVWAICSGWSSFAWWCPVCLVLHLRRWRWCQCRHFRGVMQPKHPWWRLHFSSHPLYFGNFTNLKRSEKSLLEDGSILLLRYCGCPFLLGKILNPILFCLKAQFCLISNLFGERPTFTSWTSTPLVIEKIPVWLSDYHCQYHKRYCWALDYTIWTYIDHINKTRPSMYDYICINR